MISESGFFFSQFGFINYLINALELVNVTLCWWHLVISADRSIVTCLAAFTLLFRGESKCMAFSFVPSDVWL
ncbi:hypothetical protein DVA76_18570 [Acinetobacter baumannii]|nr:hypothetical protein DVA76_18570 [Acinetobacter baumannii]